MVKRLSNKSQLVRYHVLTEIKLGKGSYGDIYKIIKTYDENIIARAYSFPKVVKLHKKTNCNQIEKIEKDKKFIELETEITSLSDGYCKTIFDNYILKNKSDELGQHTYIAYTIMSEAKGENLSRYFSKISANQLIHIKDLLLPIIAMFVALEKLHQKDIVHYDLKPENVGQKP